MLQNKQSFSFHNLRRLLFLLLAAVAFSFYFIAANLEPTRAQQQPNTNDGSGAAQKTRSKRIAPLRTSETPDGSRVTITSDGELNDYSAYRSGNRFIVVVPQAEGAGGGASGRGFEGAQVERRGKDLVYTFKLQPGATARVNQRFNRLDVQFSAPKDAAKNTNAAAVKSTPAPTPAKRTPVEEAGLTKPPINANTQPTPDARRSPDANVNSLAANISSPTPLAAASPDVNTLPGGVVSTPTLAPTATPLNSEQLAQAQPTSAAPTSIITNAPATTSPSVGAVVLRNWPWLIAALLAVGLGLVVAARFSGRDRDQSKLLPPSAASSDAIKETKTSELNPATATSASASTPSALTASTLTSGSTPPPGASPTSSTTAATASSTATASAGLAAAAAGGKQSKKQKKKADKAKRLAETNERKKEGGAISKTGGAATASKTATDAGAGDTTAITGAIIAAAAASAVASDAAKVAEAKSVESKVVETKAVEAAMPEMQAVETKAIEAVTAETKASQPSVAFDPEHIEVEVKKLLAGESYDESYINATDEGTRQLVSAELMSAIAGRNEARQGHARAAFLRHGYFDEATRALQSAEAPGERAAAARTLGLVGDRTATAHLTAALEDPAADVRRTSVEALAELHDPAAVGALEALRWRETSRQVPRTLIQRAIEASKAFEAEASAPVADDDTPTLVTSAAGVSGLVAPDSASISPVETKELEISASETKEVEVSAATKTSEVAAAAPVVEEAETGIEEVLHVSATATATPDAAAEVAVDELPEAETKVAADETALAPEATKDLELIETKALDVAVAPFNEPVRGEEATNEVEASTATAKTDLAALLAAKEATLIKAREEQARDLAENASTATAIEPFVGSSAAIETASAASDSNNVVPDAVPEPLLETLLDEPQQPAPPVASLDARAGAETSRVAETTPPAHVGVEAQPVYDSDFKVGSNQQQPAPGDDDWIDLNQDDHESTVQSIEPFVAPGTDSSTEPTVPFFAETAVAETSRGEEPRSLLDSLEIETFEPDSVAPAPIAAAPVNLEHFEDATSTQPLTFDLPSPVAPVADEQPRGDIGAVKADKSLSLADGSDEEGYSIIPKGIQVRLASDDAGERAASLLALSRLNTDEAFSEICAAFDDSQEEVRNAAARALYDLNDDRAESFTRALRESPVERRRQIGSALAGSGLADEAIGNLTGESRDKTYDAFSLLFLMAKAGEVAPLIRAIESHADSEVRLAVVKLLALSGQQEILPAFRRLAVRGSLPAEVRSAVMEAIYQISSQPNAAPTAP